MVQRIKIICSNRRRDAWVAFPCEKQHKQLRAELSVYDVSILVILRPSSTLICKAKELLRRIHVQLAGQPLNKRTNVAGPGITNLLPLWQRRSSWKDRIKMIDEPLFKGYIFGCFRLEHKLTVLQSVGIVRIVGFEGQAVSIPEEQIQAVQTMIEQRMRYDPHPLLKEGMRVRVLDIRQAPADFPSGVEFIQGSILDSPLLHRAFEGVTLAFHLAGIAHLWARDLQDLQRINYEGSQRVLEAATGADLQRIVYTASETVLINAYRPVGGAISESTPQPDLAEMAGPYSRSKWLAERDAQQAAKTGLPLTIVYPTAPIGPGDHLLTPPTRLIQDLLLGHVPAYLECRINLIAVEDVAEGILLSATQGKSGERYILGGHDLWLSQILEMLQSECGIATPRIRIPAWLASSVARGAEWVATHLTHNTPLATLEGVRLARACSTFDCSKAQRELGLPQSPICPALCRTVDWLRQQRLP